MGGPVKKFNLEVILKRWFKSGKHHIRKYKYKNESDLSKLETTEKEFFIDVSTKS